MRVHFIGVGGYGMSGLAEANWARGDIVTGCDARDNSRTRRLSKLGVKVCIGHGPDHVEAQDRVVYSTDVPQENPELERARARGIPVLHRSEVLAEFVGEGERSVVVTGTHGKTTTTTLVTHLLAAAGYDPTGIVGGEVDAWGGGVRLGSRRVVVAEGDESDGSFLRYHPHVAVVTHMEPEHLEHYGMDFERVVNAYGQFLSQVAPDGTAVVWYGLPRLHTLLGRVSACVRTYGYGEREDGDGRRDEGQPGSGRGEDGANRVRSEERGGEPPWIRAAEVRASSRGLTFEVIRQGRNLGSVFVPLHGLHNVRNTLAALEVALTLGAPWPSLVEGLATFANAHRRFEILARSGDITVVDDYAHHPTEIRSVIAAARELEPRRIVAVFQPQRYIRTQNLWQEFVTAFDGADEVILTEIYAPAGEERIPGVSGEALARAIAFRHPSVAYAPSLDDVAFRLLKDVRPGDLVLTMGAGDVYRVGQTLGEHVLRLGVEGGAVG